MEELELCICRDARGRLRAVAAPAGAAREGGYLRLVGGVFLRVEQVSRCRGNPAIPRAVQALESVWEAEI